MSGPVCSWVCVLWETAALPVPTDPPDCDMTRFEGSDKVYCGELSRAQRWCQFLYTLAYRERWVGLKPWVMKITYKLENYIHLLESIHTISVNSFKTLIHFALSLEKCPHIFIFLWNFSYIKMFNEKYKYRFPLIVSYTNYLIIS